MSLTEAVALTYLFSAVIVIGVFPMLLSRSPAWLVQADPYDEEQAWISNEHRRVRYVSNIPLEVMDANRKCGVVLTTRTNA